MKKTIDLDLTTVDGNAFSLMGAFSAQAKCENWTREEIDTVLTEARRGDYNHLVATLSYHCEPSITHDDSDWDDWGDEDDWDDIDAGVYR